MLIVRKKKGHGKLRLEVERVVKGCQKLCILNIAKCNKSLICQKICVYDHTWSKKLQVKLFFQNKAGGGMMVSGEDW